MRDVCGKQGHNFGRIFEQLRQASVLFPNKTQSQKVKMALSKPCEIKIWTSSHGTDYHHFPSALSKAFSENSHPLKNSLISLPLINAVPGRETKRKFVSEVHHDFEQIPPEVKRINVLLMGDNDVRKNDYVGACRVEQNIGQIIDFHKGSRHGLVICGLLPSPVSWKYTHFLFHRVSSRLYRQVETANLNANGRQIAYLRTMNIFFDDKGFIDEDRFFEPDRIHLNPRGAYQLAKHLIDNIIPITETFSQVPK